MKVYVDLLDSDLRTIFHALNIGSNNCNSTCMYKDCKNCWFKKGVDGLRKKFTNPQSLADYTKQVRKEVVQEIREEVKKLIDKDFKLCNHEYANGYCYGLQYDLARILEKIEKGETE